MTNAPQTLTIHEIVPTPGRSMTTTIARPDAPAHYMVLQPISRRIVVRLPDGTKVAESLSATRVIESGKTFYDPMVYIPQTDVELSLTKQDKSTHCPLKGDATYYRGGGIDELAWSYDTPLEFSMAIAELIAFYPDKVILEEHPN